MNMDAKNGGKYALRTKSIIKRIESEKNRATTKRKEPKEKQKPPPLSKYRRKTANARERNRMKEINDAFLTLQQSIPDLPGADAEKLTKITVLRLAVNYINALAGVLNEDSVCPTDIEDVRELWCLENAHMARPEHCVRPVIRTNKVSGGNSNKNKCSAAGKTNPSTGVNNNNSNNNNNNNSNKMSKAKCPSVGKTNDNRSKNCLGGKTIPKRPSKSKSKTKVCKTASIATSNGAYITLKNVALQTPPHKLGKHANNEPLMMSMTVKRPRQEHYSAPRETKMPRLEPIMSVTSVNQPQLALTPCRTDLCHVPASIPGHDTPEPLIGATPFTPRHYTGHSSLTLYQPTETTPINVVQDLDSPVVRNDVLLEFPRSGRHFSDSSSADSAFSSEGSAPPSPLTSFSCMTPAPVPIGDTSPAFSVTSSDFSVCGSTSDCDSVLTSPMELTSLLGDDPFQELDHFTSTFADGDDTLNLLLAHSSSNFMCGEIEDC
ncbi:probable serine/threonine-protein kinase nek3 [Portunus trituberculatus]|uniref:Helix-loop-helix protein delilah n=1 Tax=Portunus trituberculatus TaxID=210409 RepID=A0A5B7GF90_PORTR|nr:probable serine/threonine-protein kinase nek3 [Portunus trituberculatus]MPC55214.1 Helix-loop-helix protein delilah [Portunus trituberculatus]